MRAPQFSWAVRTQLEQLLGSADAVETGGYRVITTLDWTAQQLAERYLTAAAIVPNLPGRGDTRCIESAQASRRPTGPGSRRLRGKDIHNGAWSPRLPHRRRPRLCRQRGLLPERPREPEVRAAGRRRGRRLRQPGSAFKAIVYSTAFNQQRPDAGQRAARHLHPLRRRLGAEGRRHARAGPDARPPGAIQQSLNLPGDPGAAARRQRPGRRRRREARDPLRGGSEQFLQAGLAGAIGTVETRPIDLTAAFGSIANGGVHVPTRLILSITGPDGKKAYDAPTARGPRRSRPRRPSSRPTSWPATRTRARTPGGPPRSA